MLLTKIIIFITIIVMKKSHTLEGLEKGEFDRLAYESGNIPQWWERLQTDLWKYIHIVNICARNLEKERKYEIFNRKFIQSIFDSFFISPPTYEKSNVKPNPLFRQTYARSNSDWRDYELLSIWINKGITKFKEELLRTKGYNTAKVEQQLDILNEAMSICKEIVAISKRSEIQAQLERGKKTFLFSWKEIQKRDKEGFIAYIANEIGHPNLTTIKIKRTEETDSVISFHYESGLPEELETGDGKFILDRIKNKCELLTVSDGVTKKHKINLIVEKKFKDDLFYSINIL